MNMKIEIYDVIKKSILTVLDGKESIIDRETSLIGQDGILDSMKLVELCLLLEDEATELGFEFDWTSALALSRSRGMFRSVSALAEEFSRQMQCQK